MPFIPLSRRPARVLGRWRWVFALILTALSLAALAAGRPERSAAPSRPQGEKRLTIFYTGGIQGTLEPCGCNSDPLGGLDRYASLVKAQAQNGAVLVVDGGNLSFPAHGLPPQKRKAAELRARFLAERLQALGLSGAALGNGDLALGAQRLSPPRLAANAQGRMLRPSEIRRVGDVRVGLMGLVAPEVAEAAGITVSDPVEAAAKEAERLRAEGAELVVALAAVDRPLARKVARKAAIDFLVLGAPSEDGMTEADQVGGTFIVSAAAELQKAGRIDVVLRPGSGPAVEARLKDAGSPEATAAGAAAMASKLANLKTQVAAWEKDSATDPVFLKAKRAELNSLQAEAAKGEKTWTPPATGSYFVNRLIPIRRALPQDKQVTTALRKLDKAIGRINLAAAQPPPKAEPSRAHFVGDRECARCHEEATNFWRTTAHAHAWKTLVDGGKQADLECVGCHVTGYGHVGGSALGFTKGLENIQCEVCHGPGSRHVEEEGLEEPALVHLEVPESTCMQCHNEKHSDTFEYAAYLRDVLGPGHGASVRARLGDGPTGGQLRRAALAKAKAAGAAQTKGL